MSESRFNRHIGNKKGMAFRWRASREKALGPLADKLTRQARRMIARIKAWSLFSWNRRPRDDNGPIPRRIRRSMALALAKRKTA